MKTLSATLAILALSIGTTTCQAGLIVAATAAADGDNAVTCTSAWNFDDQTMTVTGSQAWGPGHIGTLPLSDAASFTAESELDPTVTLRTMIDNDTGSSWTGYQVTVYMNKSFSVTSPTVYNDTTATGWYVSSYDSQAVLVGDVWVANVVFSGGTAIADGGMLDFSYKLSFLGSVQYCQEMSPVPEPGCLALIAAGAAGLLVLRRKRTA
ncbi:MAG: PEP-CTERM sorting domain-containing protein [Thermoguttaceae bacterium]